jgi:hypothetical protein
VTGALTTAAGADVGVSGEVQVRGGYRAELVRWTHERVHRMYKRSVSCWVNGARVL